MDNARTIRSVEETVRFGLLLAGDPDGFCLDEAALLIAAHAAPGLDIAAQLRRIDDLAGTCPRPDLMTMMHHLFGSGRFTGNSADYYDPRNSLLNDVLDRRLGIPISLALLALEVGRRLELPIAGVGMPGHFLIRENRTDNLFADPFAGPEVFDAVACREIFRRLGGRVAWDDRFLEPVSRRSIVVRMLSNLKVIYLQRNDLSGLRWVMRLRAGIPGVGDAERDEFRRLMAALN